MRIIRRLLGYFTLHMNSRKLFHDLPFDTCFVEWTLTVGRGTGTPASLHTDLLSSTYQSSLSLEKRHASIRIHRERHVYARYAPYVTTSLYIPHITTCLAAQSEDTMLGLYSPRTQGPAQGHAQTSSIVRKYL